MTNLKRIIEVDCKTAKSIKGGDSAACNCNCITTCSSESSDAHSNHYKYQVVTGSRFK